MSSSYAPGRSSVTLPVHRAGSIGATAHLIEGTPANKQYKDLKVQGIELKEFTADFVIKNGKMLGERRDEFQKILQQR